MLSLVASPVVAVADGETDIVVSRPVSWSLVVASQCIAGSGSRRRCIISSWAAPRLAVVGWVSGQRPRFGTRNSVAVGALVDRPVGTLGIASRGHPGIVCCCIVGGRHRRQLTAVLSSSGGLTRCVVLFAGVLPPAG